MKNLIIPVAALKRSEEDSYEQGCIGDTKQRELELPPKLDNIIDVMSELVGEKLTKEDVYTFDPNVYCDTKSPPGFRVVEDNSKAGLFRVEHDRCENSRGRKPSKQEMADFEAGKINLRHATYELRFRIHVVDMEEGELAEFIGCVNHG